MCTSAPPRVRPIGSSLSAGTSGARCGGADASRPATSSVNCRLARRARSMSSPTRPCAVRIPRRDRARRSGPRSIPPAQNSMTPRQCVSTANGEFAPDVGLGIRQIITEIGNDGDDPVQRVVDEPQTVISRDHCDRLAGSTGPVCGEETSATSEERVAPSSVRGMHERSRFTAHAATPRSSRALCDRERREDVVKRRLVRLVQKYIVNPPMKAMLGLGVLPPSHALARNHRPNHRCAAAQSCRQRPRRRRANVLDRRRARKRSELREEHRGKPTRQAENRPTVAHRYCRDRPGRRSVRTAEDHRTLSERCDGARDGHDAPQHSG